MPEAETYLNKVCACIRDKRTRENVQAEMRDHLDALAADYLADGLSEDDAYRKAVADMGSANEVGAELGRIHSFFPRRRFNTALTLLFWGFLLSSFIIDFWYVDDVAKAVGYFLMLTAIFLLRRSHKLLTAAFVCYLLNCLFVILGSVLSVLPPFYAAEFLTVAVLVVGNLLMLAFMFTMSYGVAAFSAGKCARRMRRCGYLYVGNYLCLLLTAYVPAVFVLWLIVAIMLLLLILHHLWCVRTDIWRHEREVTAHKTTKFACVALALVVVLIVAVPTVTAAALTNRPATTAAYVVADAGSDADTLARVAEVKERIKKDTGYYYVESYGAANFKSVFDSALQDIRQSDLLALAAAESFSVFGYNTNSGVTGIVFAGKLSDDHARALCYYRVEDGAAYTGARQVYCEFSSYAASLKSNKRDFVTLGNVGGATVELVPEYECADHGRGTEGVEIRLNNVTDQRGYIAFDTDVAADSAQAHLTISVYDQRSFYRAPYNYDNLRSAPTIDDNVWYARSLGIGFIINGLPQSALS